MTAGLFIKTFGCQMNVYDSEKISNLLETVMDIRLVDNPADAEVLIVNTCSVREKAQQKLYSQLGRWCQIKKLKPSIIIGVGGCVASQEGQEITKRAPYVDVIFGPQTLHRLPSLINQARESSKSVIDISFPRSLTVCRLKENKNLRCLFPLWRGVVNTVVFVWFLTREAKNLVDLLKTFLGRSI